MNARKLHKALGDLMSYVGGWDLPASHPCGKAARVLDEADGNPNPTLKEAATDFATALKAAIASGDYGTGDIQHMKRLLGNVERITNA
jgi:hypothetical protein